MKRKMTFDELWKQVKGLPDTAMAQVPIVLSEDTKKRLCEKTPEEIAELVLSAASEIDHGSIESVDELVRRKL